MKKEEILNLIEKWRDDSKSVSKSAEKELINQIICVINIIDDILNMFGRSYDPHYPKLSDKQYDKDCSRIQFAMPFVEITDIDDDYIYMYYKFGRSQTKEPTKIPIDTLIFFSDCINVGIYKNKVIDAEKQHLINDMEFKEKAYQESQMKFNKFCEKYCINN